jgi:hypothetical protein
LDLDRVVMFPSYRISIGLYRIQQDRKLVGLA